jgi:hypothetical protein
LVIERALKALLAIDPAAEVRRRHPHRVSHQFGSDKHPVANPQVGYQRADDLLALAVHRGAVDHRAAQLDHALEDCGGQAAWTPAASASAVASRRDKGGFASCRIPASASARFMSYRVIMALQAFVTLPITGLS